MKKSIILCEGKDDLWFLAYYLHKSSLNGEQWDTVSKLPKGFWPQYRVNPFPGANHAVQYMTRGEWQNHNDTLALWSVGGKDSFEKPVQNILMKYVRDYPDNALDSIVIFRDRDEDTEETALSAVREWLLSLSPEEGKVELLDELQNGTPCRCEIEQDGVTAETAVTPVMIPFDEEGAVETLLIRSIRDRGPDEAAMVQAAQTFVRDMADRPARNGEQSLREKYMKKRREVLKAKFSAVSSIVNPAFSTDKFQEIVMGCDWEVTPYIRTHFAPVLRAVQSP